MLSVCFSLPEGVLKEAFKELCPQAGLTYKEDAKEAQSLVTNGTPTAQTLPCVDLSHASWPLSFADFLHQLQSLPYAQCIEFHHFSLDLREKTLTHISTKETQKLTEKECQLLHFFHQNQGVEVSKDTLLQEIWGYRPHVQTHTLETHIYRLRQKLEEDPNAPRILLNCKDGYWMK